MSARVNLDPGGQLAQELELLVRVVGSEASDDMPVDGRPRLPDRGHAVVGRGVEHAAGVLGMLASRGEPAVLQSRKDGMEGRRTLGQGRLAQQVGRPDGPLRDKEDECVVLVRS